MTGKVTLDNVNVAIQGMEHGIRNREKQTTKIISLLLDKMNFGFSTLALTESQEVFLLI